MPKNQKTYSTDLEWFENREKDLGLSRSMVAAALDLEIYKLRRLLVGERTARPEEVAALAGILRVNVSEILRRLGVDVRVPELKAFGKVMSRGRVSILPAAERFVVPAPVEAATDKWRALVVDAPQSGISEFHGSIFYYQESQVVRPDAFGRLSVCEIGDAPAAIVGVVDRGGIDQASVTVIGGEETIKTGMLISATPIRWIRAG